MFPPEKSYGLGKYWIIYFMSFFTCPAIKEIIIIVPLHIYFLAFFPYYFFYPNLSLICLLQIVLIKLSRNFFTIKVFIWPRKIISNFFNQKKFVRSNWKLNIYMLAHVNLRIFIIIFYTKVNILTWFYFSRIHFDCSVICIVVLINYIV